MAKEFLIGVDIGTQGTKAALFSQKGKCLATAFRKSRLYTPSSGIVQEDPEKQLATACQTIKECIQKARISADSIAGIGVDGQMAGIIGINKDGKNVTPYDSWLDTRCAPYISKMDREAGDEVLSKTGNAPGFNHGPKILWWMHERKSIYKQIKAFVQPGGYVVMRLCGFDAKRAFIDKTYLHFSGFADNRKNCWDLDLCEQFNLSPEKLPEILEPYKVVGEIFPSMTHRCGLKTGVPVVAGCGDATASFLACGATEEGICVDVAGTASVFAATTKTFKADKKNRTLGCSQAVTPGLWHPHAYINGGGMNLEWFRKEIANNGRATSDSRITFNKLNRLAEKLAYDDSAPLFVPHLSGRACPSQPNLRGAWVGLNRNHTLANLYRGILEGVALEYGLYRNVLKELYPQLRLKEVRITGGGEKGILWNRIKSAVLQLPVIQIRRNQGAPLGVAMLAGFGTGLFKSLPKVADEWVVKGNKHLADKRMSIFYQKRVQQYERLLDCLNKL